MLDELLEKCFNEDSTASGVDAGKIKTDVMSRIEREKPMRHFGIKALVIAVAMMTGGLMTILATASAQTSDSTEEQSSLVTESFHDKRIDDYIKSNQKDVERYGVEYVKAEAMREIKIDDMVDSYFKEKIAAAKKNGGIVIEKELDESDVTGYVAPSGSQPEWTMPDDDELEMIKQIEENPESLGLIPAGKSETFKGGYRIVNRHYINTNEPENYEKVYYSFRRVYTDDAENKLVASTYLGIWKYLGPPKSSFSHCNLDYSRIVLNGFLDHTEEGCYFISPADADPHDEFGFGGIFSDRADYDNHEIDPNPNVDTDLLAVSFANTIYVSEDQVQLVD